MAACPEQETRLDLHAAGALDAAETVQLVQHLESCAGCREVFAASVEMVSLLALPEPTAAERSAQDALPQRTLEAWKRENARPAPWRRAVGVTLAAAAAVALVILVPGAVRPGGTTGGVTEPTDAATEARQVEAQTLADFEAWAGLEPLESGAAMEDEETLEDLEDSNEDDLLGETL
ncbi:zf-HC2 domain-containing protein [Myxococcus landrumensis]|uniref:Zf-HC2 domain-containing protein n=1 Tax=Myxococcus landrumensis TaxID=2813577 RepID=A0ABX7NDD1_9BACT|nr:zf-HC2 domain-containing protein [Myxococcus landrumus]QSQ16814.1 zf-HC2 domain-containing protein [Myxococcus landrumus]